MIYRSLGVEKNRSFCTLPLPFTFEYRAPHVLNELIYIRSGWLYLSFAGEKLHVFLARNEITPSPKRNR